MDDITRSFGLVAFFHKCNCLPEKIRTDCLEISRGWGEKSPQLDWPLSQIIRARFAEILKGTKEFSSHTVTFFLSKTKTLSFTSERYTQIKLVFLFSLAQIGHDFEVSETIPLAGTSGGVMEKSHVASALNHPAQAESSL